MSAIMEIYSLIRDLTNEAEKNKNEALFSSLITIKKQMNELDEENQSLKKQLDIREKMVYDEGTKSFTLPERPEIHYCSTCYGHSERLIPMTNGNSGLFCRVCEEIWMKGIQR